MGSKDSGIFSLSLSLKKKKKMQRQTNELLHAGTRNTSCRHNPGADYRRQNPRGRGGYPQLSGFATIMMSYSSSPALVTKSLGYFWKV